MLLVGEADSEDAALDDEAFDEETALEDEAFEDVSLDEVTLEEVSLEEVSFDEAAAFDEDAALLGLSDWESAKEAFSSSCSGRLALKAGCSGA